MREIIKKKKQNFGLFYIMSNKDDYLSIFICCDLVVSVSELIHLDSFFKYKFTDPFPGIRTNCWSTQQ